MVWSVFPKEGTASGGIEKVAGLTPQVNIGFLFRTTVLCISM